MTAIRFTPEEHERVTQAVGEAERSTDGEIVTVVAGASDSYRDVALHYALGAMLLVPAAAAIWPELLEWKLGWFTGGWGEPSLPQLFLLVLVAQAVVFLVVRYALEHAPLRLLLTPRATKTRRARRRAVQLFKASAEKRTLGRVGVLLYLSLDEHRAEIVADEAIHTRVPPERWGAAMAALVDKLKAGDAAGGMVDAVHAIAAIVGEHFPKTHADVNELPDRLIEL